MSDLFLLSEAQMRRIEPYFPLPHGIARVDDRRVISGIIFVIKNGLRWRDAPLDYGPHKTIYNRFIRWSRLGVFNKIFAALVSTAGKPQRLMIDATHLIPAAFMPDSMRDSQFDCGLIHWCGEDSRHASDGYDQDGLFGC